MPRRGHRPERIVRKLGEADWLLREGQELPEVLKHLEIADERVTTFWDHLTALT